MCYEDKTLFLIKNESNETVGIYFSVSKEKLEEFIKKNKLFPKTNITIKQYEFDKDQTEDVIPVINTERFLWYELRHHHCVHVVQ